MLFTDVVIQSTVPGCWLAEGHGGSNEVEMASPAKNYVRCVCENIQNIQKLQDMIYGNYTKYFFDNFQKMKFFDFMKFKKEFFSNIYWIF